MVINFTHLQVHSHYTLLGGTASVAELAGRAAAEGMTHLALTDTNVLYGAVAFDQACRAAGIRPILGMTVTVAPPFGGGTPSGRLVLLATGPAGYRSLCQLSSLVQGSSERESVAARGLGWETLKAHRDGLICLGGGRRGWVMRYLAGGDRRAALRTAGQLAGIYGAENTYLSLELHRPSDRSLVQEVVALAERLGVPAVAVQPVYCLSLQDLPRLDLLAAIDHNCRLDAVPAELLPNGGDPAVTLHWLTRDQVGDRFVGFTEAVERAGEIAVRCDPALPDGRSVWPAVPLPAGQTSDEALAQLALTGLVEHYGSDPAPAVRERLERELAAITHHNYAPLFLVVADIVRYARQAEVPVSTRGSVANSLVAYCAGITTVDPVAHDLLFERFLNPARTDPPDIDLDLCSLGRDSVLDYVRRTYGDDRVALVGAMNTMRPRSAVRETAKAYGLNEVQISKLVALLPRGRHPDPRRRGKRTVDELLAELDDPQLRKIIREGYALVGQPHHLSVHAGGVTITPGSLTDWAPLQWAPKGFLTTQYGHQDVERLGLIKLDLLGIRALTVLAEAAALVRRHHDPTFRLPEIPLDDPDTRALLARGETIGVFQCESAGAQRTLRQLQARSVRDLAVANAFFKPGPSTGGMARTFVRRYRGEELVAFLHPALEPILGRTKGVLIFQEQILRVAREIAGLSWAQANQLRRGMSKFRPEEMVALQEQFVLGCQRPAPDGPAFTLEQAETLWEQVIPFAGYGFNQGHATAYADVSYRSAYLKTHWPAAFLCARLAHWGGFHYPAVYMAEAIRLGIVVRPPHVNHSGSRFTLTWQAGKGGDLWMGLGQVRDLRRASVQAIVAEREREPFAGLRDLLLRVPLQSKEAIHLVQCGALDGLGESRSALLTQVREIQRAGSVLQLAFDFARPVVEPETFAQRLSWEHHLLGQPVSVHPLELVADCLPQCTPLRRLPETAGRRVSVAGVRLPGRPGGPGFFLGDGETFIVVRGRKADQAPRPWEPLLLRGRWLSDEWGICWLQAETISPVENLSREKIR